MTVFRWEVLSSRDFEHLCFDLLHAMGFKNLEWRVGGGDRGRDLEAIWPDLEPGGTIQNQRWFIECKRYLSSGIPVEELASKMAWADAERPDYLLVITNSHLTRKIAERASYKIRVWERERLESLLSKLPDLVDTYFTRRHNVALSIRRRRLEYDYSSVQDLLARAEGAIILERAVGEPPSVYMLRFRCKTLKEVRETEVAWTDEVLVCVSLPAAYPMQQPFVEVLSAIFHPNVASRALCTGWSNSFQGLGSLIESIFQIIALRTYNLYDPMNKKAALWFRANESLIAEAARENWSDEASRNLKTPKISLVTEEE